MSDYESDSDSVESSDNEIPVVKNQKIKKSKIDIDAYKSGEIDDEISDNEEEEEEEDDEEGDNDLVGGQDSDTEEGEIKDDEDDSDIDEDVNNDSDEEGEVQPGQTEKPKTVKNKSIKPKSLANIQIDSDDDEDEDDDNYLQKFDNEVTKNYINEFHPECFVHNYEEISHLSLVVRNSDNIIIDPLHRTIPFLTKYEKTRVLGQRAKQIEAGSKPFVRVPENIVDSYVIAELELQQKRIPFIIRRPLPNGGCEYWNLKDLEIISF